MYHPLKVLTLNETKMAKIILKVYQPFNKIDL